MTEFKTAVISDPLLTQQDEHIDLDSIYVDVEEGADSNERQQDRLVDDKQETTAIMQSLSDLIIPPLPTAQEKKRRSSLARNWWKLLLAAFATIVVIVFSIYFLVVRPRYLPPNDTSSTNQGGNNNNNNYTNTGKNSTKNYPKTVSYDSNGVPILPDLDPSFMLIDDSTFDDSHSPNPGVPILSKPFPYTKKAIHGVTLGGWLILDPLVTPSLFNSSIPDEWTLTSSLGSQEATTVLDSHYDSFMQEDDFAKMADAGLDHVRIPIGYWAVDIIQGDPYVGLLSWQYLLRGINWARKYGLRVMVELRGVPGSQNGFSTSGHQIGPGWLDGTQAGQDYANRTVRIVTALANFFRKPTYINVTPLLDPVNEPFKLGGNLSNFYNSSFKAIQSAYVNTTSEWVIFDSAFRGLPAWKGFLRGESHKMIDVHLNLVFDNSTSKKPPLQQLIYPCLNWAPEITQSSSDFGPTIVGQWVGAVDDCAVNLRGINGLGPYYQSACSNCTCTGENDPTTWTQEKKNYLLALNEVQMDVFENGTGWFHWNWKTENEKVNPKWSYLLGWQQGWIPSTPSNRTTTCSSLKSQYPSAFASGK